MKWHKLQLCPDMGWPHFCCNGNLTKIWALLWYKHYMRWFYSHLNKTNCTATPRRQISFAQRFAFLGIASPKTTLKLTKEKPTASPTGQPLHPTNMCAVSLVSSITLPCSSQSSPSTPCSSMSWPIKNATKTFCHGQIDTKWCLIILNASPLHPLA